MPDSKEKKLVDEFCAKGSLHEYSEILYSIFERIKEAGCRISAREDSAISNHDFETDKCQIRISLLKVYDDPLEIIWTILHEFGHHLSGRIDRAKLDDPIFRMAREQEAWDRARIEVLIYPVLADNISHFDSYSLRLLDNYKRKLDL